MALLEIGLGKAAATGLSKVVGIGGPAVAREWSRRSSLRHLDDDRSGRNYASISIETDGATATALSAISQSNEINACAISIASALLLKESGKDPTARLRDLRNQFAITARLYGAEKDSAEVSGRVFDALLDAVAAEVGDLRDLDKSGLTPRVKTIVIKSAAQLAAATKPKFRHSSYPEID
jgi:hypothetical protein